MKTNIQKKIIIALLSIVAIFGTGLSCGGDKEENVASSTLNFWKPFDSSDKWSGIIEAYQRQRPNVKIIYTQKSVETYERDRLEAMAAGKGPDIFSVRNDWLPRYLDKIKPAPDNLIPPRRFRETYVDVVSDDFVMPDGKIYGLPQSVDVLALYYNRELLASAGIARPPATWPDLISAVPKLTQIDNRGQIERSAITMGSANNVNRAGDILQLLMLQSGVNFYDSSFASITLNRGGTDANGDVPAARALKFYTQFSDPSSKVYTWNTRMDYSIDAFAQGRTALTLGYSYLMPTLNAKQPFLKYGVAAIPQVSTSQPKVNLASYWAETVWTASQNTDAAWDFILFASLYEQNKKYVANTQTPSSRRDVLTEQQKDPTLGVFADNVLSAKSVVKPDTIQFEKILNELIDDVAISGLSPSEALSRAEQSLASLLNKYPIRPR